MPTQTGAVPVRSYSDGPKVTVDMFIKDPLRIAALVFAMSDQHFLADAVLRRAGQNDAGVVEFFESTPFYSDSDAVIRAEFGEVHVGRFSTGIPKVASSVERALAILISDEMERRRSVDPVNQQLLQARNTMALNWDRAFVAALRAAITQTVASPESDWSGDGGTNGIRDAVIEARKLVSTAKAPGQNTSFGFRADTMIIGEGRSWDLIRQEEFNKIYLGGNIADENLLYTGKLPNKILGLDVLVSRELDDNTIFVMQRQLAGFISDELPLTTSAMYRDEPRKTWRADIQRSSAIGIDQPLSIAQISIA